MTQISTYMYEKNNNRHLTEHNKGWGKGARMTP